MGIEPKPLSLYQAFNCFQDGMEVEDQIPPEIVFMIKEYYITQFPVYTPST